MARHRMGELVPTAAGERLLGDETYLSALQLELRGGDGRVIPTEWIEVRDTYLALSLRRDTEPVPADSDGDGLDALGAFGDDGAADEPAGFWREYDENGPRAWMDAAPRYEVQVRLVSDEDVL